MKAFGGFVATNEISLTVEAGEIRGLIGPNGAGKTTLVNLITGIYPPTSGEILLQDRSIVGCRPHEIAQRGLLRTFQVCRIFSSLTVRENLALPFLSLVGEQVGGHDLAARVDEFLNLTNLQRLADVPAKSLSGGQRALLQIACGLMHPGLVCYVLDEPFAGINPVIKETIVNLILHVRQTRAVTFIIVSHEMGLMRRLCEKVTMVINGRFAAEGSLTELAARADLVSAYLGRA